MDGPFEVFISHFVEEAPLAAELQGYLELVFGSELKVFRSSDDGSIKTGEGQYDTIMNALRTSKVYVALVSKYSASRPWINFEVGHGKGRNADVFSVLVRGTSRAYVPSPLVDLQLRVLSQVNVIEEIIVAIEQQTGKSPQNPVSPQLLIGRLREREAELPSRELRLHPFIERSGKHSHLLRFEVLYKGPRAVQLDKVWAEVPQKLIEGTNWSPREISGHLHADSYDSAGVQYVRQELIATLNIPATYQRGGHWRPLHPMLHANDGPQLLHELRFAMNVAHLRPELIIRGQIVMADGKSHVWEFPSSEIERRKNT